MVSAKKIRIIPTSKIPWDEPEASRWQSPGDLIRLEGQKLRRRVEQAPRWFNVSEQICLVPSTPDYVGLQTQAAVLQVDRHNRHTDIHTRTKTPMLQPEMIYTYAQRSLVKSSRTVNTQSHDTSTLKGRPCTQLALRTYAQRPSVCPSVYPSVRIQTRLRRSQIPRRRLAIRNINKSQTQSVDKHNERRQQIQKPRNIVRNCGGHKFSATYRDSYIILPPTPQTFDPGPGKHKAFGNVPTRMTVTTKGIRCIGPRNLKITRPSVCNIGRKRSSLDHHYTELAWSQTVWTNNHQENTVCGQCKWFVSRYKSHLRIVYWYGAVLHFVKSDVWDETIEIQPERPQNTSAV